MSTEKLEQRAKHFYVSAPDDCDSYGMHRWMAEFAHAELEKAAQIAEEWSIAAAEEIRKLME